MTTRLLTAAGVGAAAAACERWLTTWGTSAGERAGGLPGDAIIPGATVSVTRAISIASPPRLVFPWLVQLGYGRAGFYTFDRLEQAAGLAISSAYEIHPEWQDVAEGDPVHLAPDAALRVAEPEQDSHLVLSGTDPIPDAPPFDFTWAFVIRPDGTGSRLLVRERYRAKGVRGRLMVRAVQPVSSIMSIGMLRGVRARATGR